MEYQEIESALEGIIAYTYGKGYCIFYRTSPDFFTAYPRMREAGLIYFRSEEELAAFLEE